MSRAPLLAFAIPLFLSPLLLGSLLLGPLFPGSLPAQDRDEWVRKVQPRTDCTIFSPLELPAPNRMRTGAGAPGPDYWQQQADYKIDVVLDPEHRLVRGREH